MVDQPTHTVQHGEMDQPGILIVDDEMVAREALLLTLEVAGFAHVAAAGDLAEARRVLAARPVAVVLLDLTLPDGNGEQLLGEIAECHPATAVVVVTGIAEIPTAVRCMRSGAVDYLLKPIDPAALETAVRRAIELRELRDEHRGFARLATSEGPRRPEAFAGLLTVDPEMHRTMVYAEVVAPGSQAVLITGETGTGKELMARAIHRLSSRRGQFVAVNVAGLDDAMFADALFGHRRGAFTGAVGDRPGLVQQADGGTLFLDEIGDITPSSQVKLLRLLQEGEYYPLGADRPRRAQVRILAATHRDLGVAMESGSFRRDLYYRLHAHHLHLPPLRERRGDIALLLHHFASLAVADLGLPTVVIPPEAIRTAQSNPWPGNVRELAAAVHDAVGRGGGTGIAISALGAAPHAAVGMGLGFPAVLPTLDEARDQLVAEALRRTAGDLVEASRLLGMSRWGLSKRVRQTQTDRISRPA